MLADIASEVADLQCSDTLSVPGHQATRLLRPTLTVARDIKPRHAALQKEHHLQHTKLAT